jgi:hypothetical protein
MADADAELYDIKSYSDEELFEILDINNPTDRELEISIVNNMEKHDRGSKLHNFFKDMYKHFFDIDDMELSSDDEVEGFEPISGKVANIVKKDGTVKTMAAPDMNLVKETMAAGGEAVTVKDDKGATKKGETDLLQKTIETRNVDFVKDKLNPIKRETMFKMISIDSQYREDPRNTSATNFTMNLSSSIENVLSIKLYSVQIPYAWYMVNSGFGTNYFFIKGNSPGINNGNHDIKIEIGSGNYTADELKTAVNTRFSQIGALPEYADVSLGETQMIFNKTDQKARFEIDIKKTYTEADYRLFFPYWTSPDVIGEAKNDSIPSFLGFKYQTNYPYNIKGKIDLYPSSNPNETDQFWLTTTNNSFRVVQYDGTNAPYNSLTSTVYKQFDISFANIGFNTRYTRDELYQDISGRIITNGYLDHTYSSIDISQSIVNNILHDHFELNIKLNRKTTVNKTGTKIAIIFPDETNIISGLPIWVGNNSCFGFQKYVYELSEFISETPSLTTNYIISTNKNKIEFSCLEPGFNVPENTFTATVAASGPTGYLLNAFKQAINNALIELNDDTKTNTLVNGIFNIGNLSQTTFFDIINDKASFQIDMERTFDQSTYIIDLSGCFLNDLSLSIPIFGFNPYYDNLTDVSFTITKTIPQLQGYFIAQGEKIVIYPKTTGGPYGNGFGNQNQQPITINLVSGTYSISGLIDYLNDTLSDVISVETGNRIMTQSLFSFVNSNVAGNVDFSFRVRIDTVLTEKLYKMTFISTENNPIPNPWTSIYLNSSYDLVNFSNNNHAFIQGNQTIFSNTINIQEGRNTIIFKPYTDGVSDSDDLNDIIITVPLKNEPYTREQLLTAINNIFNSNSLTNGSNISIITSGNNEFTKIRMTINKTYYPKDYRLVFFDTTSFSYCGVGTSGGRSIRTGTWESTLGWLFGYHTFTEYVLGDFLSITADNLGQQNYVDNVYTSLNELEGFVYSYNASNGKISVIADSVLNTNIYNYFMIVLDDFIQNHVNDGLITITSLESDIALPTYASRVTYQCDPVTGQRVAVSASNKERMNLTAKQLYAMNQIIDTRQNRSRSYAAGPVLKDIFAIVPLKLAGLGFGQTYMEFGGTLQNQDRKYFGPVRIQKLSVKLMNDKGDVVLLNGANWSFTLICEIMVRNNT